MTETVPSLGERPSKRVLVVSPHPDDEAIGIGGALSMHVRAGDSVRVIFLTSGEQGGHALPPADTAQLREQEAATAADILGIRDIVFWRQRDGGVRVNQRLVARLHDDIARFRPDVLYVTGEREQHPDHRAAARLVRQTLKRHDCKPLVRAFEVWTPCVCIHEVLDITEHVATKLAAIRAYASQCAVMKFAEAMEGLARYRGELHCWPRPERGGAPTYAEVFENLSP